MLLSRQFKTFEKPTGATNQTSRTRADDANSSVFFFPLIRLRYRIYPSLVPSSIRKFYFVQHESHK